jgi:TolB-like protein
MPGMRLLPGILLLSLPLSLSAPSRAQADTAPPPADDAAKAPILVLPLQAKLGIDTDVTELLDDKITVELSEYPDFTVLARSDLQQMLELEAERSAIGCDLDSNSCLAEVAGAMGAQYVVSGRMGKLGSKITVTLNLFDSHQASNISRTNFDSDALDQIADAIPQLVAELVQPLLDAKGLRGKGGATPVLAAVERPADKPATTATTSTAASSTTRTTSTTTGVASTGGAGDGVGEAEDGLGVVWWLIPIGVAAVGGAIFAGGLAVDTGLCVAGGCDGWFGAEDLVGPGIMLAGAGALSLGAATALVFLFL